MTRRLFLLLSIVLVQMINCAERLDHPTREQVRQMNINLGYEPVEQPQDRQILEKLAAAASQVSLEELIRPITCCISKI